MIEKCPFCDEELDALTRKIRTLELEVTNLKLNATIAKLEQKDFGEESYVGSKNRSTFHRPSCKWAAYIIGSANYLEFSEHEEAVEAGYRPCKTCCA